MTTAQLLELFEIQRLKSQYFLFVDTKQWAQLRELFTDDLFIFADDSPVPEETVPVFTSADAFIDYLTVAFATTISVHHGHTPDLQLIDERTATGIWAMYDWTDDQSTGIAKQGFGHYHEEYRKGDDGRWRIATMRLTRLRVNRVDSLPSELQSMFTRLREEARAAREMTPVQP